MAAPDAARRDQEIMSMKRPIAVWLLAGLLVFLALGGMYGGILMLLDPSGRALQMDGVLPRLPVADYVLPGLFLIGVMGALPALLAYGVVRRPVWRWADRLAAWSEHSWAWTGSLALGIVLLGWLAFQALFIGFGWPIQSVTLINGLLIIAAALLPGNRRHFRLA
jgi:hypothetical protein